MRIPAALALASLVASSAGSATAFPVTFTTGEYDNRPNTVPTPPPATTATPVNSRTTGPFRDISWLSINSDAPRVGFPDFISQGNGLVTSGNYAVPGSGPYTALDFTAPAMSGGQSYLSIYDTAAIDRIVTRGIFDAGQPNGMPVRASWLPVNVSFQDQSTPANPNRGLGSLTTGFMFTGSQSDLDLLAATYNSLALTNPGEIGVMAMGNNIAGNGCPPPFGSGCTDSVGISITNVDEASLTPVPELGTMFLAGTGLIVLGHTARRRLFGR